MSLFPLLDHIVQLFLESQISKVSGFFLLIKLFSYELQAINRNRFRSLRPDFDQSVTKAIIQYRINDDLVERLSRPRFSTKKVWSKTKSGV